MLVNLCILKLNLLASFDQKIIYLCVDFLTPKMVSLIPLKTDLFRCNLANRNVAASINIP